MKKVVFLMLALSLIMTGGMLQAEEVAKVGEIVVEDTEEAKALQERKESSYAKNVITKKEMEELGGQTAADVLRRLPRLYFSGPPATNKDVRMAGLDKEFQNVLINGNRPPGGGEKREFALDRIPVEMIERIEILKNPTASYDSDAVAGLVNIILKQPAKKQTFSASTGISRSSLADDTGTRISAEHGDSSGSVDYSFGVTQIDDFRGKSKDIVDATIKNELTNEDEAVRTTTSSANLNLRYKVGERDTITFKPYLSEQREDKSKTRDVFNLTTGALKNRTVEAETKDQTLQSYGVEWERRYESGARLTLSGMVSGNTEEKDKKASQYNGVLAFTKDVFEKEEKKDQERVLSADYKIPLSGFLETEHLLSIGAKYRDKDREVEKMVYELSSAGTRTVTSTPNDSYSVDETITAFYVMDEAVLTERLTLTPGLRVEITDGEYVTSGGLQGAGDFTDWNPSLHALYKLGKGYQLRGSAARTIGRPPFKDKVPTRTVKTDKVEEGNPDLSAAVSRNYEAAIEKYIGKTGLVSIGGFYKDIEDIIEKQQIGTDTDTGLPVIKPVNVAEASIHGAEAEIKTELGFIGLKAFTISGNYTLLNSRVIDPNTGVTRRLKDQPTSLANAVLRYDNKGRGLSASIGMNYLDEKIDESDPLKPKKVERSFTQWDASVKKTIAKNASIFGSVANIFNEKRVIAEGQKTEREEAGTTYFIGLRYDL